MLIPLILSVVSILFLLIGTLIVFTFDNNKKIVTFSVSLGFVVLVLLGVLHLLPEAFEAFRDTYSKKISIILIVIISLIGFFVVWLLDKLGGHHNHDKEHYEHISTITCIFLVVHNLIEGMSIYSTSLLNYEVALMLTIGIGLHNLPLGLTLSSTYYKNHSKLRTLLFITLIGLSYLVGVVITHLFNGVVMLPLILGSLLTITFGMVMYIATNEFLPLMLESKNKKYMYVGLILGIILMILSLFI